MKKWVEMFCLLCLAAMFLSIADTGFNTAKYIVLEAYTPIYIEKRVEVIRNIMSTTTVTVEVAATSTKKR